MTDRNNRPLTVVTGTSSGIGLELAKLFAQDGHALVLAADRPLQKAEEVVRNSGGEIFGSLQVDLSTRDGVEQLVKHVEEVKTLGLKARALTLYARAVPALGRNAKSTHRCWLRI